MMYWNGLFFEVFVVFGQFTACQPLGTTTMGNAFLVAFPAGQGKRNLTFVLFTLSVQSVMVHLSSHWDVHNITQLNQVVIAQKKPKAYTVMEKYRHLLENSTNHKVYKLVSLEMFSLLVFIKDTSIEDQSLESFQAVPVDAWGKVYIVFTLQFQPSVQIVTLEPNKVTIVLTSYPASNTNVTMKVLLRRDEGYIVQYCESSSTLMANLTGSQISGTSPLGVITGNCRGQARPKKCFANETYSKTLPSGPQGLAIDMLLPLESAGRKFIIFKLPNKHYFDTVAIVPTVPMTNVSYTNNGNLTEFILLKEVQDIIELEARPTLVVSTKPIQLFYVEHATCNTSQWQSDESPTFTIVVPTDLFLNSYFWLSPSKYDVNVDHYVVYVAQESDILMTLKFDEKLVKTIEDLIRVARVLGTHSWCIGYFTVALGPHNMYNIWGSKFGLYLYGKLKETSYLSPAGFVSADLYSPCTKMSADPGDMVDNDCDGSLDEEQLDGIDNDHDSLVDEDLLPLPKTDGAWSDWSMWFCEDCDDMTITRTRLCNSPVPQSGGLSCPGPDTEDLKSSCKEFCGTAVNGGWSDWESWKCLPSTSCTEVNNKRLRRCNNPRPQNGGLVCNGSSFQGGYDPKCGVNCTSTSPPSSTTLSTVTSTTTTTTLTTTFSTTSTTMTIKAFNTTQTTDIGDSGMTVSDKVSHWTTISDKDIPVPFTIIEIPKRGGSWGEWSEWDCSKDCQENRMMKRRICDDPPPEPGGKYCPGTSYMYNRKSLCVRTCPEDCPFGRWGLNCTGNCENCVADCDKVHGNCARCNNGYSDPLKSCHKACGKFTFGFECRGNCLKECDGQDCIERSQGICPEKQDQLWFLMYLLLVLPVPIVILVILWHKHSKNISDAILEEKVNVIMSKSGFLPSSSSLRDPLRNVSSVHKAVNTDALDYVSKATLYSTSQHALVE